MIFKAFAHKDENAHISLDRIIFLCLPRVVEAVPYTVYKHKQKENKRKPFSRIFVYISAISFNQIEFYAATAAAG